MFSKILKGSATITSFSTVPIKENPIVSPILVLEEIQQNYNEGDLIYINETFNLHEIVANKELWMLDVMDTYGDSPCTYFKRSFPDGTDSNRYIVPLPYEAVNVKVRTR